MHCVGVIAFHFVLLKMLSCRAVFVVIITRVHADSIGSACKLHCKLCTDVDGVSCDGHSVDGKTETSQHFRAQGIYSELQ